MNKLIEDLHFYSPLWGMFRNSCVYQRLAAWGAADAESVWHFVCTQGHSSNGAERNRPHTSARRWGLTKDTAGPARANCSCFRFDWKHSGVSKKAAIETSLAAKYRILIQFCQLSTLGTQHFKRILGLKHSYLGAHYFIKCNKLNITHQVRLEEFHWEN